MRYRALAAVMLLFAAAPLWAQGQDSTPYERDLQVVSTLIQGGFDNANQSYFDYRGGAENLHRRLHVDVNLVAAPEIGDHVFIASAYWDNDAEQDAGDFLWVLDAVEDAVRMRSWALEKTLQADALLDGEALADRAYCDLYWRREAAQFRATAESCDLPVPHELVLSDRQLWLSLGETAENDFHLHRIRDFECYADIPGVGGGRDIPYDRYEGFRIHDQAGSVRFTSKQDRELEISLLLVDWPINNYEGIFTRDSLVIYISEYVDGARTEHGYAFTVPEADRIGINLKWMLAMCYMKSNRDATPSM